MLLALENFDFMSWDIAPEVISSVIITVILCIFCVVMGHFAKKSNPLEKPSLIVWFGEWIVESIENFTLNTVGPKLKTVAPYVCMLAMYLPVAMMAGLDYAKGDAVIFIDADLQDDPNVIRQMLQKQSLGYDIVYGVRNKRDTPHLLSKWGVFALICRGLRCRSRRPPVPAFWRSPDASCTSGSCLRRSWGSCPQTRCSGAPCGGPCWL